LEETAWAKSPSCPLDQYYANRIYEGPIKFKKHYYELPADMNKEEAECAAFLDSLPVVKYWVRNLERDDCSFRLQTSTDKFYPDFVAELRYGSRRKGKSLRWYGKEGFKI